MGGHPTPLAIIIHNHDSIVLSPMCHLNSSWEKCWKNSKCQVFPTHSRFQMINHKLSRKNRVSGFHSSFHTQTNKQTNKLTHTQMRFISFLPSAETKKHELSDLYLHGIIYNEDKLMTFQPKSMTCSRKKWLNTLFFWKLASENNESSWKIVRTRSHENPKQPNFLT